MTGSERVTRPLWISVFVFFHVILYVWNVAALRDGFDGVHLLNALAAAAVVGGLLMFNRAGWFLSFGGLFQLSLGYFVLYTKHPPEALVSYACGAAFVLTIFNFGYLAMPRWQEAFGVKEDQAA